MNTEIRAMLPGDWSRVKAIYESGIASGDATFEQSAPDWEQWDASHLSYGRLIAAREEGAIIGWAALTPVSSRCVYEGVAEVSVYVDEAGRGRGIGMQLLQALVSAAEAKGLWTLQAGIFPENEASLRIHQKAGFRIVGYRERIGKMRGRWRDTWLLERRSKINGL